MNNDWLTHEVYDVLARIQRWGNYTKEEMDQAIEWFQIHYWEDEKE